MIGLGFKVFFALNLLFFVLPKTLDWPVFMARHDLTWTALNGYFYDGVPTGNGLQGMLLHRQDSRRGDGNTNTFLFEINRADVTDSCFLQLEGYNWERKAIGKFALTPNDSVIGTSFRLDVWNAQATGRITTKKGHIDLKFYTHATQQVQVIEYEWSGGATEPKVEFMADNAGCMIDFVTVDYQEKAKYAPAKTAIVQERDGIFTHRQPLNAGRDYTVGWRFKKEKNRATLYHCIAYSNPVAAPQFSIEKALSDSVIFNPALVAKHQLWWHEFYKQTAFVSLNDLKYENFYWRQVYKMGSTMRNNLQMMDLNGVWYSHTPWRGIWWNWNTQGIYYPLSTINHPELVKPLAEALHKNENALALNLAPELRKKDAIGIGRASSFDLRSAIDMNDGPPFYAGREPGNLTWVMQVYYQNLLSTKDEAELRGRFFVLLKRSVNLYLALIEKNTDGEYHLPLTMSPEYKPATDCNYDLAILKWGLNTLLTLNKKYELNDPLAAMWRDVNTKLVDYPVGKYGFMIGKGIDLLESHRHFSHLMMIYPLKNLDVSNTTNRLIAEKSINHWLTVPGDGLAPWSHIVAAGMYATLGQGNKAKVMMDKSFSGFSANTMYREAGQCAETPYFWVKAFTDMLIQTKNDTLVVFPAIPSDWSTISFKKLRIEGAFLVDADLKSSGLASLRIKSEKGGRLTVKIKDNINVLKIDKAKIIYKNRTHITFEFETNGVATFKK